MSDNNNELLTQILQTLNTFQVQTTKAINDLREEVRENKREIQKSREIENEHWQENLRRWNENDKKWEQNEKRWEENERRWEQNEKRWEENDKKWEQNEKRWEENDKRWEENGNSGQHPPEERIFRIPGGCCFLEKFRPDSGAPARSGSYTAGSRCRRSPAAPHGCRTR